jgi:hypothetical protein
MQTENIKQFEISGGNLIIAEVIEETNEYVTIKNLIEYNEMEDHDGIVYYFDNYQSDLLFPIESTLKLYQYNIVIEKKPKQELMLQYIASIERIEKINKSKITNLSIH